MGYDGKKIAEANRLKAVGGREIEVGKFWNKNKIDFVLVFAALFIFAALVWFLLFSSRASPPREQPGQQQKRELEPLIPPLLFGKPEELPAPRPLLPSWKQERESMIPIYWSDHHGHHDGGHHDGGGHHGHGHHYYGHDYWGHRYHAPYYSYPYTPYIPYGGSYGYRDRWESERPRCFELRQPDGTYLKWCL